MSARRKRRLLVALTCIAAVVLLCVIALDERPITRRYVLYSEKIAPEKSLELVLLTDLHSGFYGDEQADLVRRVEKCKPDVILLSGDIVDDVRPREGAWVALEKLRDIAPMVYIAGNHEFWSGDIAGIEQGVANQGALVMGETLERAQFGGTPVLLGGIADPAAPHWGGMKCDAADLRTRYEEVSSAGEYSILLAHRPSYIETEYAQYGFDLVVSGHAHGGQARVPLLLNGLFAPDEGWFPKYAGGVCRVERSTLVVSRGLAINPRLPRVFNRPEVVHISVRHKS